MEKNIYTSNHSIQNHINQVVIPGVYETLVDDYGYTSEKYQGNALDDVHEIIDGLEEVIYTYQARKIAEAFELCPFESIDELTGEKFTSWSQMAYNVIYDGFMNKYDYQLEY